MITYKLLVLSPTYSNNMNCNACTRLANMDLPPNLKTLEINCECEDEVCLKPLSKLTNLEKLTITANKANNIEVLKSLSKLKDLTINGNIHGDCLSGLTSLTRLEMTLDDHPEIDFVSSLKELKVLNVGHAVLDCSPLKNLENLTHLEMHGSVPIPADALAKLTALKELKLYHGFQYYHECHDMDNVYLDLNTFSNMTHLTSLTLSWHNIKDASPLSSLTNLKHLDLSSNRLTDISWVESLKNLETLDVSKNFLPDAYPNVAAGTKIDMSRQL